MISSLSLHWEEVVVRLHRWKSGHKANRDDILKMLCRGAEVKIRVHERISVQAPESMQESKLFARRLQGLDEKFVNTIIRKHEIFYLPFTCSPIWRIMQKLFLSTGCLCYNSSSDAVFLDGRFLLDADQGNWPLLLRCESLQHQHQSVHVSRHLMG